MWSVIAIVVGVLLLAILAIGITFALGMRAKTPWVLDRVRHFARAIGNPYQMRTAGTPGAMASVIEHRGRVSGNAYRTPVEAVPTEDGFVIATVYGARTDWLKNVLASGSGQWAARRRRSGRPLTPRRTSSRVPSPPMEVLRFDDARTFLDRAMPLLAADGDAEARHNLMLGISGTVVEHPDLYAAYRAWLAVGGGRPLAAATRTPPFNAVLADPLTSQALDAVVDAVLEEDPETPGLVGNVPHVHRAADRWAERTGASVVIEQQQGVYALVAVDAVPVAPGRARVATRDDRHLLVGWLHAFADETTGGPPDKPGLIERMLDARLAADDAGYWLWEDGGRPVSTSGYGSPTRGGIRIGPVYTPPEHRRRGYATILVAELSRWLLGRGHRACYLYTDLANAISNSIYGKIGYRRVCDSANVRFV